MKIYPLPPKPKRFVEEWIAEMLKLGYIEPNDSPFGAPIFTVMKPNGDYRICVNYKDLNSVTETDLYPLPNIQELLDQIGTSKYFTQLDLPSSFRLLRMNPEDSHKAGFKTHVGTFKPKVLIEGMKNCPPVYQRFMNFLFEKVLATGSKVSIFIDNVFIFTKSVEEDFEYTCKCLKVMIENS